MDGKIKAGVIVGVFVAVSMAIIGASADYVDRVAKSDPAPWEGKAEDKADLFLVVQKIEAIDLQRQKDENERDLKNIWLMVCAAKYQHAVTRTLGQQMQIATLQQKHIELTRSTFPLGECP